MTIKYIPIFLTVNLMLRRLLMKHGQQTSLIFELSRLVIFSGCNGLVFKENSFMSYDQFLNKELATTALERALMFRKPSENLIHHSDRGVQYTSNDYIDLLHENDIQISM